jgi:hypothetical protein
VESGAYTGIWWYADHPTHYRGDGRRPRQRKAIGCWMSITGLGANRGRSIKQRRAKASFAAGEGMLQHQ